MPHLGPAGPGCSCWAQSCHKGPGASTWEASGDHARRVLGSVAPVAWGPRLATSASPWRPQTLLPAGVGRAHVDGIGVTGPSLGGTVFGSLVSTCSSCSEHGFIFCFPAAARLGHWGVARVGLQKAPALLLAVSVDELNLPVSEARLQEGGSRALSVGQLPGPAWLSQSRSVSPGGWGLGSPQRLWDGACAGRLPRPANSGIGGSRTLAPAPPLTGWTAFRSMCGCGTSLCVLEGRCQAGALLSFLWAV